VHRPLIAVPSYPRLEQGRVQGWHTDAFGVPIRYVEALRRAGAVENIVMSEGLADDDIDAVLDRADGLLLLGGGDLHPSTYGQDPHTKIYGVSGDRDECEIAFARTAVARGLPVLAICRGHQVLNVALGGTLDQHITDRDGIGEHGLPGQAGGESLHEIEIDRGTRLSDAMGVARATCACHHHQAVDEPGASLRVVARAPDGVVEATELADTDAAWVVSVQWHPEDTAATDPAQQRLFDAFVAETRPV
jgi:putative glutamine amidotransferase